MESKDIVAELEALKKENNKLKFMNHVLRDKHTKMDRILYGLKQELQWCNKRIKELNNKQYI